jgi:hypothetical protein
LDAASQIATGRTLDNDVVEPEIPTCVGRAIQYKAKGDVRIIEEQGWVSLTE